MLLPTRPWLQHRPIARGLVQLGPDSEQSPCGSARLWQEQQATGYPTGGTPELEGSFF